VSCRAVLSKDYAYQLGRTHAAGQGGFHLARNSAACLRPVDAAVWSSIALAFSGAAGDARASVAGHVRAGSHSRACGAGEDAGQRIIIPRRNGVELVVVAAGATDGKARKARVVTSICSSTMSILQLGFRGLEQELRSQHRKPVAMSCS